MVAIHLDKPLPAWMRFFRVLVHPSFKGQVPKYTATFTKVTEWANAQKPRLSRVGYDGDARRWFGVSTWTNTQTTNGPRGLLDCTTTRSGTSDGYGPFPFIYSEPGITEGGDSGGPIFLGQGPAWAGLTPTGLPLTGSTYYTASDDYLPGEVLLAGTHSAGDAFAWSSSAPTYTPENSKWLVETVLRDTDGDDSPDWADNCPTVANRDQLDTDGDKLGNACDPDDDNDGKLDANDSCPLTSATSCPSDTDRDGVADGSDNCVNVINVDQLDTDKDGQGDACDTDDDGDGVLDATDNCVLSANANQADLDKDGQGDICDKDDDNDGILDIDDNCKLSGNTNQLDTDGDNIGNLCDPDDDNDGKLDANDSCPLTSNTTCSNDQDGDGVLDASDNCPQNANANQADLDKDGQGDACDVDDDGDGYPDKVDLCPLFASLNQVDPDGDGKGNDCDTDDDGDGVLDGVDNCPLKANANQLDTDGDGVGEACDKCPATACATAADCKDADQLDTDNDGLGNVCDPNDDGDGVLDGADNCPLIANSNQSDLDKDGKGDVCDDDKDGDGVLNVSDNCPAVANADQLDSDTDQIGNVCDNCQGDANTDQADADKDGRGDKCDDCPCQAAVNADSDGVCEDCVTSLNAFCADYCPGKPIDNCPGINNNQDNCNRDAEEREGSAILGDACDPVPCPSFVPKSTTVDTIYGDTEYTSNGGTATPTTNIVQNNQISFTLLGSRGGPDLALPPSGNRGVLFPPVTVAETRYRYCTTLTNPPINCDDPTWVGMDGVIDQSETFNSVWHRVSMSSPAGRGTVHTGRVYGGSGSVYDLGWLWSGSGGDFKYWQDTWPANFTMGIPDAPDEGKGRFWANAKTFVGTTDTSNNAGAHRQNNSTQVAPARLANHYQSFAPIEAKPGITIYEQPIFKIPALVYPCDPFGCPPDLGISSLDNCPMCQWDPFDAFSHYASMPWAAYDPLQVHSIGALAFDGSFVPMTNNLSTSLKQRLAEGHLWVGAAESSPAIGASTSYPMMLGLSTDGTKVVERVVMLRKGMFTTAADRSERALPASRTIPTTRSAFVPVYARSTGEVFIVGGYDTSNVPRGDIWSRSLTGVWVQWQPTFLGTTTSYVVGEVLAATRSHRDNCLYVLDTPAGTTQVRLVRIGLRQEVEQLGSWTRTNTTDRRWLTLDRNGEVLLTIASDTTGQTKVFRIDNPNYIGSGVPTVDGMQTLPTAVKFQPGVDGQTYWFVGAATDQSPDVQHPIRLLLSSSSWTALGASF